MAKKIKKNIVGILVLCGMGVIASVGGLLLASLPSPDPKVYASEAQALVEQNELSRARQLYIRAYTKDPQKSSEYLIEAARCAFDEGLVSDAQKLLESARLKDVRNKAAAELSVDLMYELAKQPRYNRVQHWTRVKEEAERLIDIESESALGYQALGAACLSLRDDDPRNAELGVEMLKKSLEIKPCDSDVLDRLARDYWRRIAEADRQDEIEEGKQLRGEIAGIIEKGLANCSEAGDPAEQVRVTALHAMHLIEDRQVEEGLAKLEKLAREETVTGDANLLLGKLYVHAGRLRQLVSDVFKPDYEKAHACFERVLEIDPKRGEAYNLLATLYASRLLPTDDPETKTEEIYQRGLENIPKSTNFRAEANNEYRSHFMAQLFKVQLVRAAKAEENKDDQARDAHYAKAEEWIATLGDERGPQTLGVRLLQARLLNQRNQIIEATKTAELAAEMPNGKNNVELQLLLGELYRKQSQWGAAARVLHRADQLSPNNLNVRILLGQVHLMMGQPEIAIQYLKSDAAGELREELLKHPLAIQARISAYQQLNKPELVAEELARGEQTPSDRLKQALMYIAEEQYGNAEEIIEGVLKDDPDSGSAIEAFVHLCLLTDRQKEARQFIADRLKARPDDRGLQRLRLTLAEDMKPEEREGKIVEFINKEPDESIRAGQLYAFYSSRQRMEDAIRELDKLEKLQPESQSVLYRQFQVSLVTKDWERAERYVRKIESLGLHDADIKMLRGRLAYAQGNHAKAAEMMEASLRDYPSNSQGWTHLGAVYKSMGRGERARECFQRSLDLNPTNAFANRDMAQILLEDGDEEAARKHLEIARRAMPFDDWVRGQLDVIREKDNPVDGIVAREKKRENDPGDIENLVRLARLYAHEDVREYGKAGEAYRQALEASGNDLELAREVAGYYGRREVNRPKEGEELLKDLMDKQADNRSRSLVAVYTAQFFESMKELTTAEKNFRLAISLDPSSEVYRFAAEFYARNNQYNDALKNYERVLEALEMEKARGEPPPAAAPATTQAKGRLLTQRPDKNPEETRREARSRIIAILLTTNELERARQEIEAFRRDYPDNGQGMVYYAAYHRMGGNIDEALRTFDLEIQKDAQNAIALWQRGQLHVLKGQWEDAIRDLQAAKSFNPEGFAFQHRVALAQALLEIGGRENQAISELREILDKHPDQRGVAEELVNIYLKVRPARYSEAEELVLVYKARFPADTTWPLLMGKVGEEARNWDLAIQGYEAAVELSRQLPEHIKSLFMVYRLAGRPRKLIQYAGEKLTTRQLDRSPLALCELAWAYHVVKQEEDSTQTCDRALASARDIAMQTAVIQALVRLLGVEMVEQRLQEQALQFPSDIDRQKSYFILLQLLNKNSEAITAGEKVVKLSETDEDKVFALLGQAILHDKLTRYEPARALYEQVLQINPDESLGLNNLAYLLADRLGLFAEALPYAERAQKLDPRNPTVLDTYGWILARSGQLVEAEGVLLHGLESDSDSVPLLYHLGMVHKMQDKRRDAVNRLRMAKKAAKLSRDEIRNEYLPNINQALKDLGADDGDE